MLRLQYGSLSLLFRLQPTAFTDARPRIASYPLIIWHNGIHVITRSLITLMALFAGIPSVAQPPEALESSVYHLRPGPNLGYEIQELLVKAVPGDVIEFGEGKFSLTRQIDIATDNITLRGQGPDKTILSFQGQNSGGQGIEATGNNLVIEKLAVEDTAGNAIKVIGSRNVTFREVRTEWTGPAQSSNGAYGLYPVQCSNVLIDSCIAVGASDSGIYVGQSRDVVVCGCRAERNVAGIEIENTINADVYDNVTTNNAGGLLVFDLPGLQLKAGSNVRLFRNQVVANNHRNFAAPGNIVALVPSGTGIMIMATDQVEAFENTIQDNQTASVAIISYLISGKKLDDASYDPYCKSISIHHNDISGGGEHPDGQLGSMLIPVLGSPLPDILFDGAVNPEHLVNGQLPAAKGLSLIANGEATFANFNLLELNPVSIAQGSYKASRDQSPYQLERSPLAPVELSAHDPPSPIADKTVVAYRTAPKYLAEWGLFRGNGFSQEPADGVIPYDLNTTLFSDYTNKYRFIKLPEGKPIQFTAEGVLGFP
ncbi:MAG: right-handed parallel beta-helix repeat-containing protein, partial [bacterium]|nr:right-handed parallel beta-helix repeat-containing protein [bacterium]